MALFNRDNERRIRAAFNAVHREFEDHLQSINENTSEIMENRYMIISLQERLDKIASDIACLKRQLSHTIPNRLSVREQEVFLCVYSEQRGVSVSHISARLQLPVGVVEDVLESLRIKNIPLYFRETDSGMFVTLDPAFRELQSTRNVVGIESFVSTEFSKGLQRTLFE